VLFAAREVLLGGRVGWVSLAVASATLVVGPWAMAGLAAVWGAFVGAAARLLGESLDPEVARRASGYATAGLLPLSLGSPWVVWLAVSAIYLQVKGLEKGLPCGAFRASVLALFPAALVLTLWALTTLIFKIKVF
jgi:hypothetical protein